MASCTTQPKQNISAILDEQDAKHISFIDTKYYGTTPLAQLVNLPVYSEDSQSFHLSATTNVQVYAAGEIVFNVKDEDKKYYLRGDEIELFFSPRQNQANNPEHPDLIHYTFAYKEAKKKFLAEGIDFDWQNIGNSKYVAKIKIPWKNIGTRSPRKDEVIGFDVVIADNDDGFIQETKIAWSSNGTRDGILRLADKVSDHLKEAQSVRLPAQKDLDNLWNTFQAYEIEQIVKGYSKDPLDLSARFRTCWDTDYLYCLVEVEDSRQKHIPPNKVHERNIFTDHGWIENASGERVWEMNAKVTKHAGGAFRNQRTDTVLQLPPGKYTVRYVSDESHASNNWTDEPPALNFYGIIVYREVK